MSEPTYARVADAVWRLAGDRVIIRHASMGADDAGVDLTGLAAMVWVALDEPGSVVTSTDRLAAEELGVPDRRRRGRCWISWSTLAGSAAAMARGTAG